MRSFIVGALLVVGVSQLHAADRLWQQGICRDQRDGARTSTVVSVPIGTALFSIPIEDESEILVIESAGMLYTVKSNRHRKAVIVNDPMQFVIDGQKVFIRGPKPDDSYKLRLVGQTRMLPNESASR